MSKKDIYRIVDANANRAREGLRTVEEIIRFILEDSPVTSSLKNIRHDITGILSAVPTQELLSARNSKEDVGAKIHSQREKQRNDHQDVMRANMVRSQEALRTLEEFSKVIDPRMGTEFKNLRFRLYSLEKEIGEKLEGEERRKIIKNSKLYVILDKTLMRNRCLVEVVQALSGAGVRIIQWRDKEGSTRELIEAVRQIKHSAQLKNITLIVNDRVDVAMAAGADGVHLGQDDLPLPEARRLMGNKTIGISVHNEQEILKADKDGADYLAMGPVFPTLTKKDTGRPLGLKKLKELKELSKVPCVAIGGINRDNITEIIASGIEVAAVASAVLGKGKDVSSSASELLSFFE